MKRFILITLLALGAVACIPAGAPLDSQADEAHRILCIGNSFTYVGSTYVKLEHIARSQGLLLDIRTSYKGGYSFCRHLCYDPTLTALQDPSFWGNGYEAVFLQDQSLAHAHYGQNPRQYCLIASDTKEIVARVKTYSPDARIILEQTWSYEKFDFGGFGSLERFDEYATKGAAAIARKARTELSPIAQAFILARKDCPEVDLLAPDRHHQSQYGAYLKACVNYLLLSGKPFGEPSDPVLLDCDLEAEKCAALRRVAERTVLGL